MAKAVGVSTKELFKMMEQGQLVSSEVLPKFAKQLKIATREGGALEAGLKTSRVAMQRFGTAFKLNILDSFDAGLESGLGEFFNNLTAIVGNAAPTFEFLGMTVGKLLSILSTGLLALQQFARPLIILLGKMTESTNDVNSALGRTSRAMNTIAAAMLIPIVYLEKFNNWLEKTDISLEGISRKWGNIVKSFISGDWGNIGGGVIDFKGTVSQAQSTGNTYYTNQIHVQSHDAESTAQALRPYLTGQIDERFDYKALTSMNPAAGG